MSENISSNEREELVKMVEKHVNALSEHFECVHIFVSRNEGENDLTRTINRGAGNWFARYGQIREWLIYEDQRVREAATKSEREA